MRLRLAAVLVGSIGGCAPPGSPIEAMEVEWDTPLGPELGFESPWDPLLDGVTVAEVVEGAVVIDAEGNTCSSCHFEDTITLYNPPIRQFDVFELSPRDVCDGRSWAGPRGWASIYAGMGPGSLQDKPPLLREIFARWLDTEVQWVEPVTWTGPLDEATLGVLPDPALRGTLGDIVASRVSGRPDGLLCSECHYRGGPVPYRPDVARGEASSFAPDDLVDGRAWSGDGGWADRFRSLGPGAAVEKPAYLRALMHKWLEDGAR